MYICHVRNYVSVVNLWIGVDKLHSNIGLYWPDLFFLGSHSGVPAGPSADIRRGQARAGHRAVRRRGEPWRRALPLGVQQHLGDASAARERRQQLGHAQHAPLPAAHRDGLRHRHLQRLQRRGPHGHSLRLPYTGGRRVGAGRGLRRVGERMGEGGRKGGRERERERERERW